MHVILIASLVTAGSGTGPMETTHITKTPGVCGGKACIKGHRIRVMDIVTWHEMHNNSAQEIVEMFPGITLSDVYAALTYYFDNREEIENDFASNEALAEELKKEFTSAEFRVLKST